MTHPLCTAELVVGLVGLSYGIWSEHKRRTEREWMHSNLVILKPSIQGPNRDAVIAAINDLLEFLKPPKKESAKRN